MSGKRCKVSHVTFFLRKNIKKSKESYKVVKLVGGGFVINRGTPSSFKKHTPNSTIICGKMYILGVLFSAHNAAGHTKFLFLDMLCCVQGPQYFKHSLVKSE